MIPVSGTTDHGNVAEEQQDVCSLLKSKSLCNLLARICGLDQVVQISERQEHLGPQPSVLKNTIAAIIAAVWFDSQDHLVTDQVMAFLG